MEMGEKKGQLSDNLGKKEAGSKRHKGRWLHCGGGKSEKRTGKGWLDLWMATGTGFTLDGRQPATCAVLLKIMCFFCLDSAEVNDCDFSVP